MKKALTILSILTIIVLATTSCSRHTCPAYRGSTVEVIK